jgi:hypothetical protein
MLGIAAGLGVSLAALDQLVDWLRGHGRFAPRTGPRTPDPTTGIQPALAELLLMLEWPDARLAGSALKFAMGCSPYKQDQRLVAGCERLARIGLARRGADADHIVNAALHGLQWLDAPGRIGPFESTVLAREDLPETQAWLRDPEATRRRKAKGGK